MTVTATHAPVSRPAAAVPILELRGLEKRYTGTHALKPADLAFEAGEIHAIVGENGAGKSTLIKLLTGVTPRTSGEMIWKGRPTDLSTPNEAIALGINAVHQEVVLCPHLTVAANIFLGDEQTSRGLLKDRAMVREAQKIIDDLGFDLPAGVLLGEPHHRPAAAHRGRPRRGAAAPSFLIFDEPTAYLTRTGGRRSSSP
jgi:ribose transport system ATP-binding protein